MIMKQLRVYKPLHTTLFLCAWQLSFGTIWILIWIKELDWIIYTLGLSEQGRHYNHHHFVITGRHSWVEEPRNCNLQSFLASILPSNFICWSYFSLAKNIETTFLITEFQFKNIIHDSQNWTAQSWCIFRNPFWLVKLTIELQILQTSTWDKRGVQSATIYGST